MKGIILYYSNTGNTLLASQYLVDNIANVDFCFHNVLTQKEFNLDLYDIIGFATFTDAWDVPQVFVDFISHLNSQDNKPAFLLNTYGFLSGKTLKNMNRYVSDKGFHVLCGHSLHTPENFPPMIALGLGCADQPSKSSLKQYDRFITLLSGYINDFKQKKVIPSHKIKIGLINTLLPPFPQSIIHPMMGDKMVDEGLCNECGLCEKKCPGSAISLNPKPCFNDTKCHYCWACFNKCPNKAIYTTKYRGKYHYPQPNNSLKEKLKSTSSNS